MAASYLKTGDRTVDVSIFLWIFRTVSRSNCLMSRVSVFMSYFIDLFMRNLNGLYKNWTA